MLQLRPTARDDLDDVVAWEAAPDTARWLGETGRAWHLRALSDPDQEHLVAHDGTARIGFAVLARVSTSSSIELRRMVVAPEHRGVGNGRSLLAAALAHAGRHGARTVWLDVKPGNHRARTLYESAGFTPGTEPPATPDMPPPPLLILSRPV